jgi:hypothetical protein
MHTTNMVEKARAQTFRLLLDQKRYTPFQPIMFNFWHGMIVSLCRRNDYSPYLLLCKKEVEAVIETTELMRKGGGANVSEPTPPP